MPGVLFVTRKFPPAVGGMETLANDVWTSLHQARPDASWLVSHGGTQKLLPVFAVRALMATRRMVRRHRPDVVLSGDALMFMILRPLARALGVRLATMAMGKDVVWGLPGYGAVVRRVLPHADQVLAISAATRSAVLAAGVPAGNVHVVRLGVEVPAGGAEAVEKARAELRGRLGVPRDAAVVAMLGRLVRRKGVAWFLREVAPALPGDVTFVVGGDGEDAAAVTAARSAFAEPARVVLLGRVDDETRGLLMAGADLFVQPNVAVPGDMEGFGLVAVEAAMRGSLVVAADLEGLRDAVVPGVTGDLLPSGDAAAWAAHLSALLADRPAMRERAAAYSAACRVEYSRERMGRALRKLLGIA